MRCLITDDLSPACAALLRDAGVEPVVRVGAPPDELSRLAGGADAWLIRSGTRITSDLINSAGSLRVIGRAGVGVDNVDLEAATRRGVLVVNAPDGNTVSTAEHTCALLLSLARQVPRASASLAGGGWDRKSFTGVELDGKTLGVVGLGKVGRAVAERMRGFGMRVLAYDPVLAPEVAERAGAEPATLDRVWAESDFITFHTPLNDATRGLLNADTLARCRPGVRIVNAARGGIIDEAALLEALDSGHVGGAALDVFSEEPPPVGLAALLAHPRVVATPHIAASTDEAQEKVATQVTEDVLRALAGQPVRNPVNGAGLRMASDPEAAPYLALAERMGRIASQLVEGSIHGISVAAEGHVVHPFAEAVSLAALAGVLQWSSDVPVNLVNAALLARERGVRFEERIRPDPEDFAGAIEVLVDAAGGRLALRGAVLDRREGRLVGIDGFRFEVRPEGHLLLYRNLDRPGVVAAVGAVLAAAHVNIAGLALGRERQGGTALTVMSTDEPLSESVLAAVSAVDGVSHVRAVTA